MGRPAWRHCTEWWAQDSSSCRSCCLPCWAGGRLSRWCLGLRPESCVGRGPLGFACGRRQRFHALQTSAGLVGADDQGLVSLRPLFLCSRISCWKDKPACGTVFLLQPHDPAGLGAAPQSVLVPVSPPGHRFCQVHEVTVRLRGLSSSRLRCPLGLQAPAPMPRAVSGSRSP